MNLSAIITAKNEEDVIKRCLDSVSFADETIVIIDNGSTDNTFQLATNHGAKVFKNTWPGFGGQKNFGLNKAQGDWLLFIDADEEVSPELKEKIITVINNPKKDFYWLHIVTIFLKHPLTHLYGHNPRLFKKEAGLWTNTKVHEQVILKNEQVLKLGDEHSQVIEPPLLHHSHLTIKSYLKTMHTYTTLDAQQMNQTNHHRSGKPVKPSFFLPYYLSFKQFFKLFYYRRGFLDGYAGFVWCFLSSYYEYEMTMKYLSLQKK
jgi:glycosyltransferase involved in cell wall biosynthesis